MTEAVNTQVELASNAALQARKDFAMARGQGNIHSIFVDRADGSKIWDVEGREYIDFGSGIAVCNTGHVHPDVTAAMGEQIQRFVHTCVMVNPYESAIELAEHLNELAPGDDPKKTVFVTTGAEAIENAVKIARAHTSRRGVITFTGAFHGRTMLSMAMTGKITPYKQDFGPFPGEIYRAPYPIEYLGGSTAESLDAIQTLFKTDIAPSDVAAIVIEPVLGEGGFYPAPNDFLQGLRGICNEHGIVLVFDEIQTGFCRTGYFFAAERSGVVPDLVTTAKGIAGGVPLAAVVGKANIMDAPQRGGLGGTYGGTPLGCAAANAVIKVMREESYASKALAIAEVFDDRLSVLKERYPEVVGDVRCERGAMMAIELITDGNHDAPNVDLTKKILSTAADNGLLLLSCGVRSNVVRFLPALNIGHADIDRGLSLLEQSFKQLLG